MHRDTFYSISKVLLIEFILSCACLLVEDFVDKLLIGVCGIYSFVILSSYANLYCLSLSQNLQKKIETNQTKSCLESQKALTMR